MTSETPTNGVPAFVCGRASRCQQLPERRVRRMADGDANATQLHQMNHRITPEGSALLEIKQTHHHEIDRITTLREGRKQK